MTKNLATFAIFAPALAYSGITAPFRRADEYNHFFRAYHVSVGRMIAHHAAFGVVGEELPASLLTLARAAADFPHLPSIASSSVQFRAANRIPLDPDRATIINFPNSALYSPLVYAPAAAGIAFGRLLELPLLWLFYLARCFGALAVASLLAVAIRTLPPPAESLAILPLVPMALFQTAMISADGFTIALGLLFTAEILRLRFDWGEIVRVSRWKLFLLALLLSQLRPPYPLIGAGIFALPRESFRDRRDAYRFFGLFFLFLLVPCLLWNWIAAGLFSQMRPGLITDPHQQLALILQAPSRFLAALYLEFVNHGAAHLCELIGYLGWRNFPLPWPLIVPITAALLVSACEMDVSALRINLRIRLCFLALAAIGIIAVALVIYLTWDPVGANEVEGFHGRYFLPFLPFAMISMANGTLKNIRWCWPVAFVTCVLSNLVALGLLARATFS
jgi:uncharacterized membrane protein